MGSEECPCCGNLLAAGVAYCRHCGEAAPAPRAMEGGVRAQDATVRLDSALQDIAAVPGVDPKRCLRGPLLPPGISKLRIVDILNLFLEGVVEQLQKSGEDAVPTAFGTPCTAPSVASSGRSSTRSNNSHWSAPSRPKAAPRSVSPPQPAARRKEDDRRPEELRRLRQQAAQCQEFKEMSEQANSELVRVEGEVHRLKEQLARVSRQNKQLLLQLRQQRMSHRQELRLHATSKEDGKDVSLLTYLQDAPEHQDTQLQKDLATHSAEVRLCLRKAMRQVLLDHLTLEDPTVEALQSHVRELWASMHSLWRAELLEDIVEDIFHKVPSLCRGSPTSEADEPQWPEVAEQAEKQVLQMLERLSFVDISPGRESLRTRRAPAPPTSADTGSEDRDAAGETEMAPAKEVSPARSKRVSGEKPATPSFGSPWRRPSRSPSPTLRHAPSMPAVLIAGPVLKPARQRPQAVVVEVAPAPKRRTRSPDVSLSPRVPMKRAEVRPRSLSPEMAKRMQKSGR
ncbi:unnamed protein product [Effrenium voratum]|nr:unnamed protein product [Effrenium voratum]